MECRPFRANRVQASKAFRVETSDMWISRNAQTGDIVLRPKPSAAEREAQLQELPDLIANNTDRTKFLPQRSQELVRVTHNTRHFEGIEGLLVEDWATPVP